MVERYLQQKIFPYSGAQNSTVHPSLLNPKDITFSDNIIYTLYSTKKIRPGLSELFTDNKRPTGSFPILGAKDFFYWDSTNSVMAHRFVYYQNGSIFSYNPADDVVENISTGIEIPASEPIVFEVFYGLLIMFFGGGTTIPKKWNGNGLISDLYNASTLSDWAAASPAVDPPKATLGRKFLNRLWINDPALPGRVYSSITNDPTDFTGTGSDTHDFNINDGDPDGITAILPPKDKVLYVGKRHSLFRVDPTYVGSTLVFVPSEISTGADIGVISHNGCVSAGGYLFFPSERGYHRLITSDVIVGIDTQFASVKIQEDWINEISFLNSQFITAEYSPEFNSILVLYPKVEDSFATSCFGYSLTANEWYSWYNFNQTAITRYIDKDTKKRKTVLLSKDGDIGFLDATKATDYGQKFTVKIKSGLISPAGEPNDRFTYKDAFFVHVPQISGSYTFHFRVDGKYIGAFTIPMTFEEETFDDLGDELILGMSYLGGVPAMQIFPKKLKGCGIYYDFMITFTPTNDNEKFELLGVLMDVEQVQKNKKVTGA